MANLTLMMDTRERKEATKLILQEFERQGVRVIRSKMFVGDYQKLENPMLVIDRKHNLNELCGNVVQGHKRFAAELERANKVGIHVIVLVEHSKNIRCLADVNNWVNPRLKVSPMAVSGQRLFKILYAMQQHYGVEFLFCEKKDTGKRIIELLGGHETL